MSRPIVSALMPAYNAEAFIRPAIDSLLAQSFGDFELIVVDDASTDGTKDALAEFRDPRLVVIRQASNRGAAEALNRGLERARGRYVARQDADDVSLPDRLRLQVEAFERQPGLVLLGSSLEVIDENDRLVRTLPRPETDTAIRWRMLFQNAFANSSVMFRRSALGTLRYESTRVPSEDYALWSLLVRRGKAANLCQPLARYRVHAGQISQVRAANQRDRSDEISAENLAALGVRLSDGELRVVRDWAFTAPRSLTSNEIPKYARSLEILEIFARQPGLDAAEVGRVRREWARQALAALPARRLPEAWRAGILPAILRASPVRAIGDLAKRLPRSVRRRTAAGGVAA